MPLEKETATPSSTLARKTPWMEEPGRLQSMGLQSQTRLNDFTLSLDSRCPRPRGGVAGRDADWKAFLPDCGHFSLSALHISLRWSGFEHGLFCFHANVFLQSTISLLRNSALIPPPPGAFPDLISHHPLPADAHEFLSTSWWALCPVLAFSPDC